ncbi:MAG: prephenate dehydrogenase [Clostridiales bacterium]|nr:prephenate dehydrogenase [Clostridiales bacterium]
MKVGFIGLGLIGGSIARALKENNDLTSRKQTYEIIAMDADNIYSQNQLKQALADHTIDAIATDFAADFSCCDMIFLCAPVHNNAEYLKKLKPIISKDCILTDVGSVKTLMHEQVEELGLTGQFIGGHPMAGSERSGYENSNAKLLENAYYILTPTAQTPKENIQKLSEIVKSMNAIPLQLDCHEHDKITAAISHVPHIIAALLVNLVKNSDDETEKMRMLAAGGFKDITRIASSSPEMWKSICLSNSDSIIQQLEGFQSSIQDVIDAIQNKDASYIYNTFDEAGTYRSSIPNNKGLIHRFFELFLDISDEPGAIAIIATILGSNGISIKNIGIIHNREFEDGVLRIELYDEDALNKALKILKAHNYTIYERK